MGELPRRDGLLVGGGWDEVEKPEEWKMVMRMKGGVLKHDDLRVAVTSEAVNVHIAGREDEPLLGGELAGRLEPARCRWIIRDGGSVGSIRVDEVVIHLAKERAAVMWGCLFSKQYS
jgi:hypothetical protein